MTRLSYALLIIAGAFSVLMLFKNQPDRFEPRINKYAERKSAWVDACSWIKAHGEAGATYLAPPGRYGFTSLTNRSSVVEFKINPDGGHLLNEWMERLTDLCGGRLPNGRGLENRRLIDRAYASLSNDQLRALAAKYRAKFAVLPRSSSAQLPIVYENGEYRVASLAD